MQSPQAASKPNVAQAKSLLGLERRLTADSGLGFGSLTVLAPSIEQCFTSTPISAGPKPAFSP